MDRQLQRLPIGIQDFEKIRRDNYLYIDKTEYMYRLINDEMLPSAKPYRTTPSVIVSKILNNK